MSTIAVIDRQGGNCGSVEIPEKLLVKDRGEQAVKDVVTAYLAGRRAGTASTLTKSEVSAGNKKPWRQKGLGRARAGYRSSPIWRGGGVAFGPKPRSYAKQVNRKVLRLAFRRAFSEKLADGTVRVVDSLALPDAKTRSMAALLKDFGVTGKVLVLAADPSPAVVLAARNLPRVELLRARDVNTYQLLMYPVVLVERTALDVIMERLGNKAVAQ